jgi:hypothetical protein
MGGIMRSRVISMALAYGFILSLDVAPAAAQRRAPARDMWAVGGSIGLSVPTDPSLDQGFDIAGNIERYLTSRVSVRGQIGTAWWDIVGRHFTGTVNPVYLDGNVVYNWEGGKWHPYVTGGIGMYRFRSDESLAPNGSDTNVGGNFGGGIEYFYSRRSTITGEGLYHAVGAFNTPLATFPEGSSWTFMAGVKHYF